MFFTLREPLQKTTAVEKGKIILSRINKVIKTRFPDLLSGFNRLTDNRKRKEYSMSEILAGALFMFIFKETSRNAYNNDRREENFRKNFVKFSGSNCRTATLLTKFYELCRLRNSKI